MALKNNPKPFFEGWYFKHQLSDDTLALIPGIHIDGDGNSGAFIQMITNTRSYYIEYPYEEFEHTDKPLMIRIGKTIFTQEGITVDIDRPDVRLKGTIRYGAFTPLKSNIMGPFRFFPRMECRHGVVSLFHTVGGDLALNGQALQLQNGIGYLERDWGRSFPKSYLWSQCSDDANGPCCVMVSVADIPYLGMYFKGCICSVYFGGREYRLATYKGVKIVKLSKEYTELRQGKYRLIMEIRETSPQPLLAPQNGTMMRTIHENASCKARFRFYKGDSLLLDLQSERAGFEFVK